MAERQQRKGKARDLKVRRLRTLKGGEGLKGELAGGFGGGGWEEHRLDMVFVFIQCRSRQLGESWFQNKRRWWGSNGGINSQNLISKSSKKYRDFLGNCCS